MHSGRSIAVIQVLALLALALGAYLAGCSSGGTTTHHDAGSSPDATPDCGYPVVHNEAGCPATYSTATLPPTCAPVGLTCQYPGAGDGTSSGCASTAVLWCMGGAGDAGPHWSAAQ